MVYSTFMATVFGMLFAYLTIENTWLSIIPCIVYFVSCYDCYRIIF